MKYMVLATRRTKRVIELYVEFVRLKDRIIECDGDPTFVKYFLEKFLPKFRREVPKGMQKVWGIDDDLEERIRINYSPL